jgi:NADH:ubiquinone oxidoreductase subunit 5 (subunit L)/multisubunit Na+/H+ antiporter MnhA subunit
MVSAFVHAHFTEKDNYVYGFLPGSAILTFYLLVFVSSNNDQVVFGAWVGLVTSAFLLIDFWNRRVQADQESPARLLQCIDMVIIIFLVLLMFEQCKSLDFASSFLSVPYLTEKLSTGSTNFGFCTVYYQVHVVSYRDALLMWG